MLCAIYDMKDNEQCLGTFDKVEDAANYLGIKTRSLYSQMSRKQLVNHRFKVVKIDLSEGEEPEQKNVFQDLIDEFKPKKIIFPEYDEFKVELAKRLNEIILDEEWKKINGFEYSVSNYGRIINNRTKKFKTPENSCYGYQVYIYNKQKRQRITIKRLVAEYFIRPVQKNERVVHIDGDINNNYFKNLKIVKKQEDTL